MKLGTRVHLLLGSNLGDREANLQLAHKKLANPDTQITNRSGIYQTAPWGDPDQPDFLNQVVELQTSLTPIALLEACQDIEEMAGPPKTGKWGARYLDIDILFYGNEVIDQPGLQIPHPHLHTRKFTLVPLAEIAPDLIHPVLKKPVKTLLNNLSDPLEVKPYSVHAS